MKAKSRKAVVLAVVALTGLSIAGTYIQPEKDDATYVYSRNENGEYVLVDSMTFALDNSTKEDAASQTEHESLATDAPETEATTTVTYILNKNSKKIHTPDCSAVSKISEKNRSSTTEYAAAIAEGYEPCKRCNP